MSMIMSLMLFRSSHALLAASSTRNSYTAPIRSKGKGALLPKAAFLTRGLHRTTIKALSSVSSTSDNIILQTDDEKTNKQQQKRTALLWLSPNRLRLKDNLALTKAAELGPDGLAICVVWPHKSTSPSSIRSKLTPAEAFGYAAVNALDHSLGEFGQKLWLIPSEVSEHGGNNEDCDPSHLIADAVQQLRPTHVIVDACLLDRHDNHTSRLRDKLLQSIDDDENTINDASTVIEVMDEGTLIPFDKVAKALGRSRQGGRALRWSTFLSNTMARQKYDVEKPTWETSGLPPQMRGIDEAMTKRSSSIPKAETFPSWAQQLLSDWGEISEDEAIRRAARSGVGSRADESSSPLTERGSEDTKLSPYLRWGVISPQRAAEAGVRERDLLWRDWSYICYGLLGPLRRGDAVLDFMDKATCLRSQSEPDDDKKEDDAFNLWCVGNTGSKLVDAGMRQLWAEGWMPRRIRLLAAACLVEGLGIDWRLGRDWFKHTLVDHDPAINELMWQNAGLCGIDPFYNGIAWEVPPKRSEDEEYVEKWINHKLVWPSHLKPYSSRKPSSQMIDEAESKRSALRAEGVYRAARTISNSGVRVAWPGLESSVKEGEVMGVGVVPMDELDII